MRVKYIVRAPMSDEVFGIMWDHTKGMLMVGCPKVQMDYVRDVIGECFDIDYDGYEIEKIRGGWRVIRWFVFDEIRWDRGLANLRLGHSLQLVTNFRRFMR